MLKNIMSKGIVMLVSDEDINICMHFAEDSREYFGAVTPPIVQTSLFAHPELSDFADKLRHEREHYIYSRGNNPTVNILEKKLAALEKGEACKCFASGMGAISATLHTLLKAGDHILFVNNVYGPALSYAKVLEKLNISHSVVFVNEASEIEAYLRDNTVLIYFESPSTHNMDILDLRHIAAIAKRHHILSVIDNTWATPLFQKPLTFGIDIVIHSCTKYIGGHSDVIAGAVISSHVWVDKIFEIGHQFNGAALSPFNAWLLIRGLRTLPIRMQQHHVSMLQIYDFLSQHPKVAKINHPLAYSANRQVLASQQLRGLSSLFSIELAIPLALDADAGYACLVKFCNALQYFQIGVSWGGFESLVIVPNNHHNGDALKALQLSPYLVRLYIGLEAPQCLIDDLRQALDILM